MLEQPVYPDIRRQGPRFVRAKKHWKVDAGRAEMQVENIPQLQEAAVLQQSYTHGSQGAYGRRPTFDLVVNQEFRPPLQTQEDVMPLSRLPRRTVLPNINPQGPEAANQSMVSGEIEGFLTDRVKEGTGPVRYFRPLDTPLDNSVLPDLQFNLPQVAATSGRVYASRSAPDRNENLELETRNPQISATAGYRGRTQNGRAEEEGLELFYLNPQISASAGRVGPTSGPYGTEIEEFGYVGHQVAATAGYRGRTQTGRAQLDTNGEEYDYTSAAAQISASAGYRGRTADGEVSRTVDASREVYERERLGSRQAADAGRVVRTQAFDPNSVTVQSSEMSRSVTDARPKQSFIVPNNTFHRAPGAKKHTEGIREKKAALQAARPTSSAATVPRAGITTPQTFLRKVGTAKL